MAITLYLRNDSHTVNTKTEYKLDTSNTDSCLSVYSGYDSQPGSVIHTFYHYTDIYILHENGTATQVVSNQMIGFSTPTDFNGIKTKDVSISEKLLSPTDAIYVTHRYIAKPSHSIYPSINNYEQWVSPQLGYTKLKSCTITLSYRYEIDCTYNYTKGTIYWGNSSCESKISGFDFASTHTLSGYVYNNTNQSIKNAIVTINDTEILTNQDGYYEATVESGTYDLSASKECYSTDTATIEIIDSNITQDFIIDCIECEVCPDCPPDKLDWWLLIVGGIVGHLLKRSKKDNKR